MQGARCLLPYGSWVRLQAHCDPELNKGEEGGRVDGINVLFSLTEGN